MSLLHAFPLHLLQPMFQHTLFFHFRLERGLDDVRLNPLARVFSLCALVNELLSEYFVARHEWLAKVLVLDEFDGTELHGKIRRTRWAEDTLKLQDKGRILDVPPLAASEATDGAHSGDQLGVNDGFEAAIRPLAFVLHIVVVSLFVVNISFPI